HGLDDVPRPADRGPSRLAVARGEPARARAGRRSDLPGGRRHRPAARPTTSPERRQRTWRIRPGVQCARRILVRAFARRSPMTRGTRQITTGGGGGGGGGGGTGGGGAG